MRKQAYILVAIFLFSCAVKEQHTGESKKTSVISPGTSTSNPYSPIDISPMDMSYFPVNYSQRKMSGEIITPPVMRVIYSRPQKNGRVIFGNLISYGSPWRLGANEASEIEFFQNVTIQDKKVAAGRYVIYCIPYEDKWTIILNNDVYTWGLKIDSTKDLIRFDIPVKETSNNLEYFTMVFEPASHGAELVMAWDNAEARLPINF